MILKAEFENWRKSWKTTKSGRLLSINGINNIFDIIRESVKRSYAASVQNTTLKQGKYGSVKLQISRQECESILIDEFLKVYNNKTITEQQFIDWETTLAKNIRKIYHKNAIKLYTYGNAQKWINITIKYLFSSDYIDYNHNLFEVCFLPIDRIIQDKAYKKLGAKKLPVAWSKCDNWQDILDYEKNIKNAIKQKTDCTSRLWWECNAWQKNNKI